MSIINVQAGDFAKGKHSRFSFGVLSLATDEIGWAGRKMISYSAPDVISVEIANEESVKRAGGTVGWGVAGAVLLGPVGLLAGLLIGGRGKDVTFVATFKDGKKVLATTDSKTYTKVLAMAF